MAIPDLITRLDSFDAQWADSFARFKKALDDCDEAAKRAEKLLADLRMDYPLPPAPVGEVAK